MRNKEQPHILHNFEGKNIVKTVSVPFIVLVLAGALVLGGATGFLANMVTSKSMSSGNSDTNNSETSEGGSKTSAGILDKETFKDTAEGTLREGGFEGEGSFHLERPGGESQNVYLTSTTVDLSEFVGKEVRVWGQTFDAKKAGWLMDVGYIEVSQ
ncbi:hypothetical protein IPM65_00655 [Candidatus Roizmanbacteria bacterium]|nr:MAG: hypothetical protein IPM65_00655 [Candidatus Roizmanbacteria bacterium]